jgi:hypothetical protein
VVNGTWNIINDMNNNDLAFTIYDGNWKAGTPSSITDIPENKGAIMDCRDELYTVQTANYFNALRAPAMYAPGKDFLVAPFKSEFEPFSKMSLNLSPVLLQFSGIMPAMIAGSLGPAATCPACGFILASSTHC